MKVLMINKFLYPNGGSETYIFKIGECLEKNGHEVQYFGMEHSGRCVGNRVNAYTSDMDFHGGSIFSKLTYPIKTIYSSEARKQIRKVLDDFKPDICHINNFNYQLTPSIILEIRKWNKNCSIIFTAHDYQLVCPNHMLNNPNTHENCEKCRGTGAEPGTSPKTCPTCNGSGQVRVQRQTPLGNFVTTSTCDRCGGRGTVVEEPCHSCAGKGKVRKSRKITVKIPAGVDTGNVLPLRGQGEHGANGGPPGDIYVRINVARSSKFDRRGNDIYIDTHISMSRAALGCEITVPTVDGDVKYTVPAGTQSGTLFRLKGKGVPRVNGSGRGDQYVKVVVEIPKNLNEKQVEALKAFMEACGEEPDNIEVPHKKGFKNIFKK